jgi:hypothetical protein
MQNATSLFFSPLLPHGGHNGVFGGSAIGFDFYNHPSVHGGVELGAVEQFALAGTE